MSTDATIEPQSDGEFYHPSRDLVAKANVPAWEAEAARAERDLSGFWAERAQELGWYRPWDTVLDESEKPFRAG